MARSSIKNNRNAAGLNNIEYGLFKKWGAMISLADQHALDKMNGLLKFVKRLIGDQIYLKSMTESRLSAYDEKIYVCYDKLMACYRVIVELYKENQLLFADGTIKNIYDGLFDIIASRTKAYEEPGVLREGGNEKESANPIALEKNEIIYESLRLFGREFDQKAHQFKTEKQRELLLSSREKLLLSMTPETDGSLSEELCRLVEETCGGAFFTLFIDTAKRTVLQLNDLEKRKTAAYYFELLNREHDILRNIIKVQAGALETYILAGAEDERTIAVIQLILQNLREIYQHYGKQADEILATHQAGAVRKEPAAAPALSGESFIGGIMTAARKEIEDPAAFDALKEKFIPAEKILKAAFQKAVKNTFDTVTQASAGIKEQQPLKKVFSQTEMMADQMTAAFEYIDTFYNQQKESLLSDAENTEIIAGVAETIAIKTDSIRENKAAFTAAAASFLVGAAKNLPGIPPEEIAPAAEQCYEAVVGSLKILGRDDRRGIGAALIRRALIGLHESEAVARYFEKLEKTRHQKLEEASKQNLRFIKDHLLFEMTTFEEIIVYSVSRLRESENPATAGFVAVIDRQAALLAEILHKNGIESIYPAPRDQFNGKEHEVLMAEKNEDYKKGEIIKVMNGGYKYGDTVLLRANVIAAR